MGFYTFLQLSFKIALFHARAFCSWLAARCIYFISETSFPLPTVVSPFLILATVVAPFLSAAAPGSLSLGVF